MVVVYLEKRKTTHASSHFPMPVKVVAAYKSVTCKPANVQTVIVRFALSPISSVGMCAVPRYIGKNSFNVPANQLFYC